MRRWANSITVRRFPCSPGPTTADCCSERQSEVLVEGEMSDHRVGQTLSGGLSREGRFLCKGSTGKGSSLRAFLCLSVNASQTVTLRLLPAAAIKTRPSLYR